MPRALFPAAGAAGAPAGAAVGPPPAPPTLNDILNSPNKLPPAAQPETRQAYQEFMQTRTRYNWNKTYLEAFDEAIRMFHIVANKRAHPDLANNKYLANSS